MKKLFILLTSLVISCNIAYASSNNLINPEWWETATLEDVRKEIEAGTDVNCKDDDGETALMFAIEHSDDPEIIKVLIEAGADVNAKYNDESVLYKNIKRIKNDNPSQVRKSIIALVENGADVNEELKETTIFWYAYIEYQDFELTKLLIEAGADVSNPPEEIYTLEILSELVGDKKVTINVINAIAANFNKWCFLFSSWHNWSKSGHIYCAIFIQKW